MENIEGKDQELHHYMTPLLKNSQDLKEQGFTESFIMSAEGLKSAESGEVFQPNDLKIVGRHRFEGISDPGDMSILYAVESSSGVKGLVVDAFGTYSDHDLGEFMKNVEEIAHKNNPGANQYSQEDHQIIK